MKVKSLILTLLIALPELAVAQGKTLSWFVDSTLKNNPQLFEFQNLIQSNSIDSQLIVAANTFQINGNGNAYYSPVINGWGYDAAITNGQQLSALVSMDKQIYNKRNLHLQFRNLQLQSDSINITAAITRQDIKKAITTQYVTTYGDQLQIDFNNDIIALLSREESALKKLTQNNVYKQAEYLAFLVTLQQQELTRSQLIVQYQNDYATLNYLAGITDTTTAPLAAPEITFPDNFISDRSAFFLKYQIDSLQLVNQRSLVAVGYRPKVSLFADAGDLSSFMLAPYKNFGTNIGI